MTTAFDICITDTGKHQQQAVERRHMQIDVHFCFCPYLEVCWKHCQGAVAGLGVGCRGCVVLFCRFVYLVVFVEKRQLTASEYELRVQGGALGGKQLELW